jgi:hypothetical protein
MRGLAGVPLDVVRRCGLALLAAGSLGGCAFAPDALDAVFTDPAKYDLVGCKDLAEREGQLAKREQELRDLMDKASQGTGGGVANAVAYRTDYLNARGELRLVREVAQRKECARDVKRGP